MNVMVSATREGFDMALEKARQVGTSSTPSGGLAAPTDGVLQGKLSELWSDIEAAFRQAFVLGRELAGDLLRKVVAKTEQALQDAGAKARELQKVLLEKLRAFLNELVRNTISGITPNYEVGGRRLSLSVVSCKQKLIVTGSLTTNITELFSLVSSGELEVEAEYTFAPTVPGTSA